MQIASSATVGYQSLDARKGTMIDDHRLVVQRQFADVAALLAHTTLRRIFTVSSPATKA